MRPSCLALGPASLSALWLLNLTSLASAQSQTWIRQFGTEGYEFLEAAAPDGSGGVYVLGEASGSFGGPHVGSTDVWLARFDRAGNQTWIRQFGSALNDYAYAAAPDGSGGVVVVGDTAGDLGGPILGDWNVWLARFDGAGNQVWLRQLGASGVDHVSAVAPDGVGGVYVSGHTDAALGGPQLGGDDAWLARYDGAGTQLWIRQFGTVDIDYALALARAGSTGVFVGGYTAGDLGGPTAGGRDAWLARYDGAGNRTWIRQFGTSLGDRALAAAPDGSNGVFVSGYSRAELGGPHAGHDDAWLARYDGAGNQRWIRQFGSSANDQAVAVASDSGGGVFVSGWTDGDLGGTNAGLRDAWLARYDGAGNRRWLQQLGSPLWDVAVSVTSDGAGGVFTGGSAGASLGGPHAGAVDPWLARHDGGLFPTKYCAQPVPNSTGLAGSLNATGSATVAANDVTLEASQLPQNSTGFFLASRARGLVVGAGGSQGSLCLGGAIGRFVGPGQVLNSGATGSFTLAISLTSIPTPLGSVAVQPGETWHFQAWHRDANPSPTSNFTDASSAMFF